MLERLPVVGPLFALSRSTDALEIARNVHVPAPAGGDATAGTTGPGRTAERPDAAALAAAGGEARGPAAPPDRSLAGLRPPSPDAGPADPDGGPIPFRPPGLAAEPRAAAVRPAPPDPARARGAEIPVRAGSDSAAPADVPVPADAQSDAHADAHTDARPGAANAGRPASATGSSASPILAGVADDAPGPAEGRAGPGPALAVGREVPAPRGPAGSERGPDEAGSDGLNLVAPARPAPADGRAADGRPPEPETERAERLHAADRETEAASPVPSRVRADAPPTPARDIAAVDGWTLTRGETGGQQVERAGIIASFVLNAAMIPGWPPPCPFAVPEPKAQLDSLSRLLKLPSDAELLALLERRRGAQTLLARLREALARPARRLRIVLGLAALEAAVASVLDAIQEELARFSRQEEAAEEIDRRLSV